VVSLMFGSSQPHSSAAIYRRSPERPSRMNTKDAGLICGEGKMTLTFVLVPQFPF
jgi:hypothetical protein